MEKNDTIQLRPVIILIWLIAGLPIALVIARYIVGSDAKMTDRLCYSVMGVWAMMLVLIPEITYKLFKRK